MGAASVKELTDWLRDVGVSEGDILVFEAPELKPQDVEGGLDCLAECLQEIVGPGGTLVVPTCTPTEGYPKPVFDALTTPSEVGQFSEFFRKLPNVVRSHSPTHSVAARGAKADQLVFGHRPASGRPTPWGEGAFGKGAPWDLISELNAWWILLGSNWQTSPFTTYVQALYKERHSGITKRTPFPHFDAKALGDTLEEAGLLRSTAWGQQEVTALRSREAIERALSALEENPDDLSPSQEFKDWLAAVQQIGRSGYLQAGVAKVKITPQVPCLRWDGKQLTGVFRDLYARAVVFSQGTQRIALVLCDLLGISGELVDSIRQRVHEGLDIPPETVMVACTHSHSTPDTMGAGYEDTDYRESLVEAIVAAIQRAAKDMQAVRIGWGRVPIRGLARSRRRKLTDGHVFTTRYGVPSTWRVDPALIAAEGPIDRDLTVIRVERLDGELLAAISNFGCHASVALLSSNISGDFPGEAMAALETILGEQSIVLCTNGAAANVDPTAEMPYWGPRSDAMARHLGRIFAAQVLECLERVDVQDLSTLAAARELVDLDVRREWVRLLEAEQERIYQEFSSGWSLSPAEARLLREQVIHTEVQALRLGALVLVGFPGEVFAELALDLKSGLPDTPLAVVELANDDIGYLPTIEAFAEGGYEVGDHLWGRAEPEAARVLQAAARRVIERVT